jgi:hypothetical protein
MPALLHCIATMVRRAGCRKARAAVGDAFDRNVALDQKVS